MHSLFSNICDLDTSDSMTSPAIIGIIVVLVVIAIGAYEYHKKRKAAAAKAKTAAPTPAPAAPASPYGCTAASPCPRPAYSNLDCGYHGSGAKQAWYDLQNQGAKNDYCRNTGANWAWTCALAGAPSSQQYATNPGWQPGLPSEPLSSGDVCYQ